MPFKIFDKKFSKNRSKYIIQCCLAGFSIFIILFIYSAIYDLVVVASLGATCFIVFLLPHTTSSHPRTLIGSYSIAVITGSLFSIILGLKYISNTKILHDYSTMVFAALAVGLAMFSMVITNTEHPPAAGLALGLVFEQFIFMHVSMIMLAVLTLILIRFMLRNYLINLR